ncbi:MAG TPA: hypothetical protein VH853_22065 [Polyangia bacterium]|nr:hypothetical protein [Polyangia bacterium]
MSSRVWASDADPFAEPGAAAAPAESPAASKVPPAPASAPPESAASLAPGIVEQLPASAYPEPVIRGLYGGPLWLDMQGLQWPYTPQTGVGISGYGWLDNNYRYTRVGDPNQSPHYTQLLQQGRFVFRVTPTYTNGRWFVQAQAELVANKDQVDVQPAPGIVGADDVWVRTGVWQTWDVTVGRFQAFDVYPTGMGLEINTFERLGASDLPSGPNGNAAQSVPQLYAADYLLYRPGGPGNIALHLYPQRFFRVELLGQYGSTGPSNSIGGRPAVIFDMGWLKLKGALEYQYNFAADPSPMRKLTQRNRGGAGSAQFVFAPFVEAGVNFGAAVIDQADSMNGGNEDAGASGNRLSFGGFVDVVPAPGLLPNLMLGGGGNYASFHNLSSDPTTHQYEQSTNTQYYVAAQYLFYRQLYLKVVGGYAKSHFQNINTTMPYDDDMFSVRVRVMYLY